MARGRPKIEDPRDRSLPEVRVTEREDLLIGLKAAIYSRGNVSALVRDAVLAHVSQPKCWPTVCVDCGVAMEPSQMVIERRGINFTGVPAGQCPQCKQKAIDSKVVSALEALASKVEGPEVDVSALVGLSTIMQVGCAPALGSAVCDPTSSREVVISHPSCVDALASIIHTVRSSQVLSHHK